MVLEKKEEVTALDMRLQALDKDLDWKKEVTAFLAIKVYTNTVEPVFDEPLYSVTSPLGYLYSRDTSLQGTQKIWSRKNVQIIFVFVMAVLKRHLCSGRDALFPSTENTDSTSIQGTPQHPKRDLHKRSLQHR